MEKKTSSKSVNVGNQHFLHCSVLFSKVFYIRASTSLDFEVKRHDKISATQVFDLFISLPNNKTIDWSELKVFGDEKLDWTTLTRFVFN